MYEKVLLTFEVFDRTRFAKAYENALKSSGFTLDDCVERMKKFHEGSGDTAALWEVLCDALDLEEFGVEPV